MNETNFSYVTFNNNNNLTRILNATDNSNVFTCELLSDQGVINSSSFIKFSPLIDPLHHITRSSNSDSYQYNLPNLITGSDVPRLNLINNSSYVDNFFYYLSSRLSNIICFPHATDYYGSVIGIMKKFQYNIGPDLPYLCESPYFHKNNGTLFELSDDLRYMLGRQSGAQKRINIASNDCLELQIDDITYPSATHSQPDEPQLVNINDMQASNEQLQTHEHPSKESSAPRETSSPELAVEGLGIVPWR